MTLSLEGPGGPEGRPLTPSLEAQKCFRNFLLFLKYVAIVHNSNSKVFQPCFARHIISQLIQIEIFSC